jgi:hypothetical protein
VGEQSFSRDRLTRLAGWYNKVLTAPDPPHYWRLAVDHALKNEIFTREEIMAWERIVVSRPDMYPPPAPLFLSRELPQAPPAPQIPAATTAPATTRDREVVVPFPTQSSQPAPAPPATATEIKLDNGLRHIRQMPFDPEEVGKKIVNVFSRLSGMKVGLEYIGHQDSPRVVELKFRQSFDPLADDNKQPQPDLIPPQKLANAGPSLKVYAHLPESAKPVVHARSGYIGIEVQKPKEFWHPA